MTGGFLKSNSPLSLHMENITFDVARFEYLYESFATMQCNYPEAYLTPIMYFSNIITENSNHENLRTPLSVIRAGDPGNFTIENID